MVDDQIFREVDEELRQERLQAIWNRYGTLIVGGIVALVCVVGAVVFWQNWQNSKRQDAGDRFVDALQLMGKGETEAANKIFGALQADGPGGYELLASLHLAANKAQKGETAEAEVIYKKILQNPSADKIMTDYAKLNLALLKLDGASFEETKTALGSFLDEKTAWRSTALEVIALAALKEKKLDEARKYFSQIVIDQASPASLKRRAQIMLDVIAARKVGG